MEIKVKIIYGYDLTEAKKLQELLFNEDGYQQILSSNISTNYFGVDIDYFIYDFLPINLSSLKLKASQAVKDKFQSIFEKLTLPKQNALMDKYGSPSELFLFVM